MKKLFSAFLALVFAATALGQSYPSPTYNNVTVQGTLAVNGTFTATGKVGLASLAAQAANTVVANVTGTSGSPTAVALPSCSAANSALQYVSSSGWNCGTSFALTSGTLAQFASTTSAQLAGVISDETGTGPAVFGTAPTISNLNATGVPVAPTATTGTNTTQLATTAFVNSSITASSANGRLIGVQIFTSSGTYTPDTGTNSVVVEIQAAGGGGGGAVATGASTFSVGAGGSAGGYIKTRLTSAFSGAAVVVGAAGTSSAGASGTTGGNSSFGAVTAGGGAGGGASTATASATNIGGATGGTATGGSILNIPGAPSSYASVGSQFAPGVGANSVLGSGGTGSLNATGGHAAGYGAGGGGAGLTGSMSATAGGSASPGIVIVWEFS